MSEPRWLDEREDRAWRGYTSMQAQLSARLHRNLLRNTGLSLPDYEVLVHLSEAPDGRLRSFQLGAALQWEKSRLSHHLTRMEGRGLVERQECTTDGRGAFVVITAAGSAAIEAAAPSHVSDVREALIDVLTPAQLDALAEIAEAVLAQLAAAADQQP
jgi:DNA-binding MarR family transcriptional regulator